MLLPSTAAAQQIGVEGSIWNFVASAASTGAPTNRSASIRLGLPLRTAQSVLQAGVTFASERDFEPGLLHLELEVVRRLLPDADDSFNLFVSGGAGGLRFAAEKQRAIVAECYRNPLCFLEGVSFQTGWRPTVSAGFGADLPIMDALLLQPTVRLVGLLGPENAGPTGASYLVRFGAGLTWRRER